MVTLMILSGWVSGQNTVGIWQDLSIPKQAGHADPKFLSTMLKLHGFNVKLLSSSDLANREVLTPKKVAVVVLPYGAYFPAEAVENFRSYLKAGGKFICLGGYAFDEVYERDEMTGTGRRWRWEKFGHEKVQADIEDQIIRITVLEGAPVDWHRVRAVVKLRPGWHYFLTGKVRTEGIKDGHGAYLAADYYDANGNRISFQQTQVVQKTNGWRELGVFLRVPSNTVNVTISAIVHGHGTAEFADISVKPVVNARWGEARDWLHIEPDQFAIFDPSFRIDGATVLERSDGQGTEEKLRLEEPVKGYAAVGLVGNNDPVNPKAWARLVPILIARDRYGRYLGPAFSVMYHFSGPYAGSIWAFCGIESHDLTKIPTFQKVLVQVINLMLDGVYLHGLKPSLWCYQRCGEKPEISVKVRNDGTLPKRVTVRVEVYPMPKPLQMGKPIVLGEQSVTLSPREQRTVAMGWEVPENAAPLYAIRAVLFSPSQPPRPSSPVLSLKPNAVDELWSGFCVWDEAVLRNSEPIAWMGNTLCEWHGNEWQPKFLFGTNQTGVVFAPEATWENPLQWEFEFALMKRMGLKVLRVLHISHFHKYPYEEFWARYDALVLMAHRHGLVLMPCLHDWMGVSVDNKTLSNQCKFVSKIGDRYKDAPRIVWDIENEAWAEIRDQPDLRRMFNEWLRERYGDESKLQAAWGEHVKFRAIPFQPHKPRNWNDLKFRDIQHFRRWLVERWVKANLQALRKAGAKQPVTDEIDWKICGDHYEASQWLDFTNLHYYGDRSPDAIAVYFKFHERLHRGNGFAVGEFGARDHPSFRFGGWGYASTEELIRHFVNIPLLTFAMGGTMVLNWDWKDLEACIFPWGLVHQHGIFAKAVNAGRGKKMWQVEAAVKTSGKAFAAMSRFMEQGVEGEHFYRALEDFNTVWVALVVPDEHLLGSEGEIRWSGLGPAGKISAAIFKAIEAMMRLKVHFHIVREWEWNMKEIHRLNFEIAVFPTPFVWRDETFAVTKWFVENGGIAIITGDFTFDIDRKRTRTSRVEELLGFEFVEGIPSPLALDNAPSVRCVAVDDLFELREWEGKPCVKLKGVAKDKGQVLAATEKGEPVVVARELGAGLVVFCADAPEFRSTEETVKLYKTLLWRATQLAGLDKTNPPRARWVLGRRLSFGTHPELFVFGVDGFIFVAANPTEQPQQVHFREGWHDPEGAIPQIWQTVPPKSSVLTVTCPEAPRAAVTSGELKGKFNGRSTLVARSEGTVLIWGESSDIGRPFTVLIPLNAGVVEVAWSLPKATVTVSDLLTGKILRRFKVVASSGVLRLTVPQDLIFTEWRLSD